MGVKGVKIVEIDARYLKLNLKGHDVTIFFGRRYYVKIDGCCVTFWINPTMRQYLLSLLNGKKSRDIPIIRKISEFRTSKTHDKYMNLLAEYSGSPILDLLRKR
ncbi:MAG: hypothetical protein QXE50_05745 [Nitrososphaerota archaeon]